MITTPASSSTLVSEPSGNWKRCTEFLNVHLSHLSDIGYMLLYLTVLQMLTLFCTHLLMTRTAASIFLVLLMLAITGVGGYVIHIGEIPSYLWWSESMSPQRWLMPIVMADEFSQETLSNTAGQQLCRNKHVRFSDIQKELPNNRCIYVQFLPFHRCNDKRLSFNIRARCRMGQKCWPNIGCCLKITYLMPMNPNRSHWLHWLCHWLYCFCSRVLCSSQIFVDYFKNAVWGENRNAVEHQGKFHKNRHSLQLIHM